MRKVLALVLAFVMVAGMATVAMAKTVTQVTDPQIDGSKFYTYDAKTDTLTEVTGNPIPGKTYYMLIKDGDEYVLKDAMNNFRLKASVEEGKKVFEKATLTSIDVKAGGISAGSAEVECTLFTEKDCNHESGTDGYNPDCTFVQAVDCGHAAQQKPTAANETEFNQLTGICGRFTWNGSTNQVDEADECPHNDGCGKVDGVACNLKVQIPCSHIKGDPAYVEGCTQKAAVDAVPAVKTAYMAVKITTSDNYVLDGQDVDVTLRLACTKSGNSYVARDVNFKETFYYETVKPSTMFGVDGTKQILFETDGYAQDEREETTIFFGDDDVEFYSKSLFKQPDLFIRFSDDVVDKYEELYGDKALLEYVWFTQPKGFKQAGTLTIPAAMTDEDKAPYLYQEKDGKLVEIKNAYDKNEEAFILKDLKLLGKYIISDVALDVKAATDNGNGGSNEANPETGANDVVAIAAGLAVVSLVAAGAVSLKK